jgi:hypothetical protein
MVLWAAAHEETGNQQLVQLMRANKAKFVADIRARWELTQAAASKQSGLG